MLWIYNIGIVVYGLLLKAASLFNTKAKLFIVGRQGIFERIAENVKPLDHPIWFHFASLGEFEQGRPVLEQLKKRFPLQHIVVTFFSPSGYEVRKTYALAEVFYLPLDTAANAKKFIEIVNPKMAIFTKYEFWYHYFHTLHQKQIPIYIISSIFRPEQVFFKWYGSFYRRILTFVTHFFVQNEDSLTRLTSIGITNVSISGDTRFDRVFENAIHAKRLPVLEHFCGDAEVVIGGSTWPADEQLLADLAQKHKHWKFVIAPHEIDSNHIEKIENTFRAGTIRYSQLTKIENSDKSGYTSAFVGAQTLIIDNIGMLSSLYQYGKVAYIGGGFGVGIHNTLEAAAFGLPVIFGPKYDKFQEAKDLISLGAAKSISDGDELEKAFQFFAENEKAADTAKNYVEDKRGATNMIVNLIKHA